ncbi:hypothetical protein RCH07_003513 [Arthrobacter sp. CG_A4]|nr:hypothetical protein [Arthrobacter sp. CG_A4]
MGMAVNPPQTLRDLRAAFYRAAAIISGVTVVGTQATID